MHEICWYSGYGALVSPATHSNFGTLLKRWRGQRGMSQMALALRAEVSARHVCFLETSRAQPSREMVMQIADALGLSMRDCNDMMLAARFSPLFSETALEDRDLKPVRRALDRILKSHEPYPAFVLDRLWNIVRSNRVHQWMLEDLLGNAVPVGPVNALRLVFDPQLLRTHIRDWDTVARVLWHKLQRQVSLAGPDDAIRDLFVELNRLPGVRETAERRPPGPEEEVLVPLRLVLGDWTLSWFSTIATIGTPQDVTLEELRIETMFPADESTERFARDYAATRLKNRPHTSGS